MTATAPARQRTLSKSDFKLASNCDAKLYFREHRYPEKGESDPYLQMLAWGGYMVEALAKAGYPDGIQLEYGRDHHEACRLTLAQLRNDPVTLFEGTLLCGRRLGRADILQRSGDTLRLIEVKSGSFDSAAHRESLDKGGRGLFITKTKPYRVHGDWIEYVEDVAYQLLIAERLLPGLKIVPCLRLVDVSRQVGIGDVPTLFEIVRKTGSDGTSRVHTARFIGDPSLLPQLDIIAEVDVSVEVEMVRESVEERAARLETLLDAPLDAYPRVLDHRCRDCEFRTNGGGPSGFGECWGELAHITPHMFELFSIGKVNGPDGVSIARTLVETGKASLFDIPEECLRKKDGTIGSQAARQLRQIACARSGEFWLSDAMRQQIDSVRYPAHFVDFEVSRLALPYHAGMRPWGQVAFQWSSHSVAAASAAPSHAEWLNTDYSWPNERFLRALRAEIGDEGSVVTWSKFERSTLREVVRDLARFGLSDKELAEWVEDVARRRMIDMWDWAKDHFHHPGMGGKTSIKSVLDALWKSDAEMRSQFEQWMHLPAAADQDPYAALPAIEINGSVQDVREGTGAIRAYEAMMYGVEKTDEKAKAEWRQLLLRYCALDSLSMVLIFEHLRRRTAASPSQ